MAITGCSFEPGRLAGAIDDAGGSRDASDANDIDSAPVACGDWTPLSGHFSPCALPPGPPWTPGNALYDTTTGLLVPGVSPNSMIINGVRVVSVDSFTLPTGVTLRVVGTLPLVLASWSGLQINGVLDASSVRVADDQVVGPGARGTNAQDGGGNQDCGGGGGGGFGSVGGDGGNGSGFSGGNGGGAEAIPTIVLGGRAGGEGGQDGYDPRGLGGAGGGAVHLIARQAIAVSATGRINAGGAGGQGARNGDGGGGGGGSGGFIGLDAPTVALSTGAILAANGGGGGTGCDDFNGPEGTNAQVSMLPAAGGAANTCDVPTAGGSGAAGNTAAGFGGNSPESGGGGGGGVGYILVWTGMLDNQAIVSPSLTPRP